MPKICVTANVADKSHKIEIEQGEDILQALRSAGIYVAAVCGGKGVCGKCKVRLVSGALEVTPSDEAALSKDEIAQGWRLACKACPTQDVEIQVQNKDDGFEAVTATGQAQNVVSGLRVEKMVLDKQRASVTSRIAKHVQGASFCASALGQISDILKQGADMGEVFVAVDASRVAHVSKTRGSYYGVAIDIGTTTLGFALVDLESGKTVENLSAVNKQREYGADVISRIVSAGEGAQQKLTESIRTQISENVAALCAKISLPADRLIKVAIAGNTTMLHFLLGFDVQSLGLSPFTPVSLEAMSFGWGELFSGEYTCPVDILAGFSTYVGADITAGILFADLHKDQKPAFLLDIGTNGEMAVCRDGKILCTSTAAGPALEGGKIQWGIGSVPGAISGIMWNGSGFDITTIGDAPPAGICGSGVIDGVHQILLAQMMNKTGRIAPQYKEEGGVPLASTTDGQTIRFTQKDIREVQLGKSAIRSGIDILIKRAGLSYDDIEVLYLAGGFGYHLRVESCVGIGLIPAELAPKIKTVGNSSLGGAVRWLVDGNAQAHLSEILDKSEEFSLSEDKTFNDMFIENMAF